MIVMTAYSYAALTETTLTCRVETELRNGTVGFMKKVENITLELVLHDDQFVISGYGEMANVVATNSRRMPGKSNINDRSTASKFEVDLSSESEDEKTQKKYIDEVKFRLDRVSGALFSSRTLRSINSKANAVTTGKCHPAIKQF